MIILIMMICASFKDLCDKWANSDMAESQATISKISNESWSSWCLIAVCDFTHFDVLYIIVEENP